MGAARLTDGLVKAIPSYAAFVAAETARSGSINLPPNNNLGFNTGLYRTTVGPSGDGGVGSPWGVPNGFAGVAITFIRHSFPDQSTFNAYRTAGRLVSYTVETAVRTLLYSVNRNGFTTEVFSNNEEPTQAVTCADFRYYDDVLGPVKMNPLAGTGPTPYTLGT